MAVCAAHGADHVRVLPHGLGAIPPGWRPNPQYIATPKSEM
jgi:hypothetical protein